MRLPFVLAVPGTTAALLSLLLLPNRAVVAVSPGLGIAKAGQQVCVQGVVMDNLCINLGNLFENPNQPTLIAPGPTDHTVHCLVDVPGCVESGYEILADPMDGSDEYCRSFAFDRSGNDELVRFVYEDAGDCQKCTGDGTVERGLRVAAYGTVTDEGTASEPATLAVTSIALGDCDGDGDGAGGVRSSYALAAGDCLGGVTRGTSVPSEGLTVDWEVIRSDPRYGGRGTLDVTVTYTDAFSKGWAAIGVPAAGKDGMIGADAFVARPGAGDVAVYKLESYGKQNLVGDAANNALISPSFEREIGFTTFSFRKFLEEDGFNAIDASGLQNFIWATGDTDALMYHGKNNKGKFTIDLSGAPEEDPEVEDPPAPDVSGVAPPGLGIAAEGQEVCASGYVMDNFCIQRGNLFENPNQPTLIAPGPEAHTVHCLVDVPQCVGSGYEILVDPMDGSDEYCRSFQLDDDGDAELVRFAYEDAGDCEKCTGDGTVERGLRVAAYGTVTDGGTAEEPATLRVDRIELGDCNNMAKLAYALAAGDCLGGVTRGVEVPSMGLTVSWEVVRSDPRYDGRGTLDVTVSYTERFSKGWAAIGVPKAGSNGMVGADAFVGLPNADGTGEVAMYKLESHVKQDLVGTDEYSLLDPSFKRENGVTMFSFRKFLEEDGFNAIDASGLQNFIWATGDTDTLTYHGANNKGIFTIDLSGKAAPGMELEPVDGTTIVELSPMVSMRYAVKGDKLEATVLCKVKGWCALGIPAPGKTGMVGADAIVALPDTNETVKYFLKDTVIQTRMEDEKQTLEATSVFQEGGTTNFSFTKLLEEKGENPINPSGDQSFIYAYGRGTNGNTFSYHEGQGRASINLLSGKGGAIEDPDKKKWATHGILATLAWGFFTPIAVAASWLRDLFPPGGLWFKVHQAFNSLCSLLTVASVGFAISIYQNSGALHFKTPHPQMGLAIFVLVFVQVTGGAFRPHLPPPSDDKPKSTARKGWEILHKTMGIALVACSFWQIDRGLQLFDRRYQESDALGVGRKAFWGWIGTWAGLVIIGFVCARRK